MKPCNLSQLVEIMQPAAVEVVGEDCLVGPDVVIDSRAVTPGALFIAIPGERVDGHYYGRAAQEAGAAAVVGMAVTDAELPHLLGEDSVQTLSWIARGIVREAREKGMISIGITGSSGKTSTKDLVAQVLAAAGPTVAPEGSLNNEIGVPLTACRIDDETQFLVSEMGSRGRGHLKWLTSLVGLDIACVLNVGQAHLGEFGGLEMTALAKAELVEDLQPSGWAVLNADDELVKAMAEKTVAKIAWVGLGELPADADLAVSATRVCVDDYSRPSFTLRVIRDGKDAEAAIDLQLVGRHQVHNALVAAAVGSIVGLSVEQIAERLNAATAQSHWRMALHELPSGVTVINDSYNANPDSMAVALRTVAEMVEPRRRTLPGIRAVAVLGDMLELGENTEQAHKDIGILCADLGFDEVVGVGESAKHILAGCANRVPLVHAEVREAVVSSLRLSPGDVVLIKGSRGVGLEQVAVELGVIQ